VPTISRLLGVLTFSLTMASTSVAQEAPERGVAIASITADSFRVMRVRQLMQVWTADGRMVEGRFASADSGQVILRKRTEPILFANVDMLYTGQQYPVPFAVLGAILIGYPLAAMVSYGCGWACHRHTPMIIVSSASIGALMGAKTGLSMKKWKLRYSRR
jgi:hypothetical protein